MNSPRLLARVCAGVSALGIALTAHATVYTSYGYLTSLQGPMIYTSSPSWVGLMQALGVQASIVPPARPLGDPSTLSFSGLTSPVGAQGFVTTNAQDTVNGITSIATVGGIHLAAASNFAGNGGNVTLSNFSVDLASATVFADVTANGTSMGSIDVFTATALSGPAVVIMNNFDGLGETAFNFSASGLQWTLDGQNAIIAGLRFNTTGASSLTSITDAGSLSTSPVPEPSSTALLGTGLAAFGLLRRSTWRRQPAYQSF